MIVVGLTGGITSGKSTISGILAEMGAEIVNADELGHQLLKAHTETWEKVVNAFGRDILSPNGDIDRQKLGRIVFHNTKALQQLNHIMHPRIYQMVAERIDNLRRQQADIVVLEAALLIEAGWSPLVDEIWVAITSESTALQRLMTRDNLTQEQALARIRSQTPVEERVKQADVIIDTSGSLDQVRARVIELWDELKKKTKTST